MRTGDVWVIANPAAGSGRGSRFGSVVARSLHERGINCRLVHPPSAERTASASAEAVHAGARAVIASGGDGTVHAVIQALAGTDIPFGIVAGGSGDDIAASLGFPCEEPAAMADYLVRAVMSGGTRRVDLGQVVAADGAEHYFLGVLSTGFDSAVNERANRMSRLGGQRYNIAIARELASFKPVPYRVRIDGTDIQAEAMLVAVGNGHRYGGGMQVCPQAVPDDGILDVTWLHAVSKPTFLRAMPSVFTGEHVNKPFVSTHRGSRLSIDAPGQVAYADGERVGPLPIHVEVRPAALSVLTG